MRRIEYTRLFKRDLRREKSGQHGPYLQDILTYVTDILIVDKALPRKFWDHPLKGDYKDCRDCHLKPDLVLIYRIINHDILELVRIGSHSELDL